MASNYSAIGIPDDSNESLQQFIQQVLESGDVDVNDTPEGKYYIWQENSGGQAWLQVTHDNELLGVAPAFIGQSQLTARISRFIQSEQDNDLEGAIYAWANPQDDSEDSGDYPFLCDVVNAGAVNEANLPITLTLNVSAFAHELTLFADEQEFKQAQQQQDAIFSSQSFIPTGLFNDEQYPDAPPKPLAYFIGHIVDHKLCRHPLTNNQYYWMLVKTLGGTIDVVSATELIEEPINNGGIISGRFWLSTIIS